jgi:hypothetical protein
MNTLSRFHPAVLNAPDRPKPKTLTLRLSVGDRDLRTDVKRAFDLAKSAGRELNATFTLGTWPEDAPR